MFRTRKSESSMSAGDGSNGLYLKGHYIPEELLILILSNLDEHTLVKSRLVCKRWRDLACAAWHDKAIAEVPGINHNFFRHHKLSWVDLFWLCHKRPFFRNLVQNPCGQAKMKSWSKRDGGNGWIIEKTPKGCDAFPGDFPSCFVTSYLACTAEQCIDLRKEGLSQDVMDRVKPEISISEWYVARFDCGGVYKIAVTLLNSDWEPVNSFTFEDELRGEDRIHWRQVKHTFKNYKKGVRFINFYHEGRDTQFWAGHYGCKMTGASVTVSLPTTFATEETSDEKKPTENDSAET